MVRRTLVVHTGGIGDFVLACPALQQLAQAGPLELAGRKTRLQLAVDGGIAAAAHNLESIAFDSLFSEPKPALIAFMRRFERVMVWMRDDGGLAASIRAMGVPEVSVAPGLPPEHWARHASEYYAECLGVSCAPDFRLTTHPTMEHFDVIVHPGSGAARKNWPMERYLALAGRLAEMGRSVNWCMGPAEEGLSLPDRDRGLLPAQSLCGLASWIAGACLYIGNDSGITHLAAAVGCPTVAVFGPTNPEVWAPRGNHVEVVRGEPWPAVEDALSAVLRLTATR